MIAGIMKENFQIYNKEFEGPFNLPLTIKSGQTSQPAWLEQNGYFHELVVVKNKPCLIKIKCESKNVKSSLEVEVESPYKIALKTVQDTVKDILGLNDDLNKLYKFLEKDPELSPTIEFCRGLRVFKAHNPFECVISSIASANNSIIRWNRSIRMMREKWGDMYHFSTGDFYTFPNPREILEVPEHEVEELEYCGGEKNIAECVNNLKTCGFGYRGNYIKRASKMFNNDLDLNEITRMNYEEAFQTLLEIPGVGPKVADCILLYGFGRGEAFPVDVWISRIISKLYFHGEKIKPDRIREYGRERFGKYAGYVQLYLFHYARKSGLLDELKP